MNTKKAIKFTTASCLIAATLVALPATVLAQDSDPKYEKLMKDLGDTNKKLRPAIQSKNADDAAALGAHLVEIYKETVPFWEKRKAEDAVGFAKESLAAATDLTAAAKAGDWTKASDAGKTLGKNCKACHEAHREKDADGKNKIK